MLKHLLTSKSPCSHSCLQSQMLTLQSVLCITGARQILPKPGPNMLSVQRASLALAYKKSNKTGQQEMPLTFSVHPVYHFYLLNFILGNQNEPGTGQKKLEKNSQV